MIIHELFWKDHPNAINGTLAAYHDEAEAAANLPYALKLSRVHRVVVYRVDGLTAIGEYLADATPADPAEK